MGHSTRSCRRFKFKDVRLLLLHNGRGDIMHVSHRRHDGYRVRVKFHRLCFLPVTSDVRASRAEPLAQSLVPPTNIQRHTHNHRENNETECLRIPIYKRFTNNHDRHEHHTVSFGFNPSIQDGNVAITVSTPAPQRRVWLQS